ncbi:P-loop containing nucleoside triphosphate hydrolase protein [Pseudoneurospora amorphoporcata]|uniref:P-loop containing nucleoside triphosphate hydrolase protein n=1 Tax=Pseudoneurospora amorphoporcata TaxID=241081 RepID=A0AAN6NUD9_9PEZI|nr:P-loop containing nucleoside triphosphate hydrolase protein [Pseudoneurospora amorphoporcata]
MPRNDCSMRSSDLVVLVIGMTGSGKSRFVTKLTGHDAGEGHDLQSCTISVDLYSYTENGRRIFVADTPGFNDTHRSDVEILKDVAFLLGQLHVSRVRVGGILYLQPITDNRVSGSALRTFNLLREMCGAQGATSTALVTTKWDMLQSGNDYLAACAREKELKETLSFWGSMKNAGSQVHRWLGDELSARSIVRDLIYHTATRSNSWPVHQIQSELVEENRYLGDTSAGRTLVKHYDAACHKLETELDSLRSGLHGIADVTREEFERYKADIKSELRKLQLLQKGLRVSQRDLFDCKRRQYREIYDCAAHQDHEWESEKDPNAGAAAAADKRSSSRGAERWTRAKRFLERNALPLLGLLAGVGVIVAGAVLVQPLVIIAGANICAASVAAMDWGNAGAPPAAAGQSGAEGNRGKDIISGIEGLIKAFPASPTSAWAKNCSAYGK